LRLYWCTGLAIAITWPMASANAQDPHPNPLPSGAAKTGGDAVIPGAARKAATACRLETAGSGKVVNVLDGRSFLLADGREIRLAGIEVPLPPLTGADGARAGAAKAARAALAAILDEQTVELRQSGAAVDRYGRVVAYAYLIGDDGTEASAADEMLSRGFAQVSARVGERACAEALWARERTARTAKLGLWGEPYYVVMGAQRLAAYKVEPGQFSVVEGKVLSVRESGGTIYI
jgi:endonuclease YncB( thermonuclease family)